ncbi:MAG: hypothetical protein QM237_00720 [Bacteroidota bacterium]|jgi:hypothetical protein|nr:hypothetical protein [Bacteroidota bacterium]HHU96767.1 hypothetical protein [Petrimonas sp.]
MKIIERIILVLLLLTTFGFTNLNGQTDAAFGSVPVVNGKVVFQQFIPNADGVDAPQQYVKLQKWGRERFQGNPLLSAIRFDDKARSVTISAGVNLSLPATSATVTLRYRLDISVANAGTMLVVRDISFQGEALGSGSAIPKTYGAEQVITDQAINGANGDKELRTHVRQATLNYFNGLHVELSSL